ncbi:MAG TPA: hypothetical protein VK806_07845 [Bacteroidia bacterium]|nr:hypothetical protein [Bacteroidia bacterium]
MCKYLVVILFFLAMWCKPAFSQGNYNIKDSSTSGVVFNMSYAAQWPSGDIAKVFGFNSNVQLGVYYKTKTNWLLGIQGAFIFGNILRATGILDSIATSDGNLIGSDGTPPEITYAERGWDLQLSVGKIISFKKPNPNSGIVLMLSGGYIRHHILIQSTNTPQIEGGYLQGYDRLTAGFCVTEFLGYQYMGNHRLLNFFAGVELTQGFTKSLVYDFDLRSMNTSLQHEYLNGFRIGWILPIYKQQSNQFYTY